MDTMFKERFMGLWEKYFGGAQLPIAYSYGATDGGAEIVQGTSGPADHRCVITDIRRVLSGRSLAFGADSFGCFGGKRYLGFSDAIMPNFEYFLSCGIPGVLEGERYKKTPELVKEAMAFQPAFQAPGNFFVAKRWDKLDAGDEPEAVVFFASVDVLSGLFTLANFDRADPNGVFAPFGAGCATIVHYPLLEKKAAMPRGVIGMFDVSARPCVNAGELTFAVPMNRFVEMVGNMEESFLITASWETVRKRIGAAGAKKGNG